MGLLPDERTARRIAREAAVTKHPVVIDIELWPLIDTEFKVQRKNLDKYITVLQWIRNEEPNLNLGYFGRPPLVVDHWVQEEESSYNYRRWQEVNGKFEDLAVLEDAIYIHLYNRFSYRNRSAWIKFALANIKEAKRYNKPVYVFLWP